jgi:hypothetical protein
VFVEITIVLVPSSLDQLVKFAKVVLMNLGNKTNAFIAADCFEYLLVVVYDGSRISIDIWSALLDGNLIAYDAKVIFKCLVFAEPDSSNRRAT